MYIGVIIGTVVATRKDEKFVGHKLLLTQPVNVDKEPIGEPLVAIDTVGAGIGEFVFSQVVLLQDTQQTNPTPQLTQQ